MERNMTASDRDAAARLAAALSGLDRTDALDALEAIVAVSGLRPDLFDIGPPPSQRRERRPDVVTCRVRVDLSGTKPPLWRRLELASDLFLDELHDVLQVAFGWLDGHLHRFGSGPDYYARETEYYLCPWEVEDGDEGIPEQEVRVDEVLVDVGDRLFYAYDYGDDWQHVIELEAILPRDDTAPRAVCTKARRDGPPEDCGGVYGYELITAAADPTHPDHAELTAEFRRCFGGDVDPLEFVTTPCDLQEINAALEAIGLD